MNRQLSIYRNFRPYGVLHTDTLIIATDLLQLSNCIRSVAFLLLKPVAND